MSINIFHWMKLKKQILNNQLFSKGETDKTNFNIIPKAVIARYRDM